MKTHTNQKSEAGIQKSGANNKTSGEIQNLEYLRGELRAERISYGELHELQTLAEHIAADDVELLEAAGVPEFPEDKNAEPAHTPGPWVIMPAPHGELDLKGNNGNTLITVFPNLAKIDGVAYTPSEQDAANLRLIAAAPELLAALNNLLALTELHIAERSKTPKEENDYLSCHHIIKARAIIAKTTGK